MNKRESRMDNIDVSKPTVYCRKDKKDVPVWMCLGSYMQSVEVCRYFNGGTINISKDYAELDCSYHGAQNGTRERKRKNTADTA
jgi:hypothetical protein